MDESSVINFTFLNNNIDYEKRIIFILSDKLPQIIAAPQNKKKQKGNYLVDRKGLRK